MIQQTKIGLNSRTEANPYNEDGFLPLITAPMYSVVDDNNYQIFLDNKIQVCLPRNTPIDNIDESKCIWYSLSLDNFVNSAFFNVDIKLNRLYYICIISSNV